MKKPYIIISLCYPIVTGISLIPKIRDYMHLIYTTNELQSSIFTGLLTVGAFLLSMKTFIIFKLKDDLYDNPAYIKKVQDSLLVPIDKYDHYQGLKELSDFLSLSILGALVGAAINITLGYIGWKSLSAICLSFTTCAMGLLFYAWWLVWRNLKDWLNILKNPNIDNI